MAGPWALMSRWVALVVLIAMAVPTAFGADRSGAVRAEFQRHNPCPSTGRIRGPCPGFQVDHREALICGGRDELDNLQWLSIEEHRDKTKVEVKLCRPPAGLSTVGLLQSPPADQHGGGLNTCGCHFNRKTGECHCHRSYGCGCKCQPAACPGRQ